MNCIVQLEKVGVEFVMNINVGEDLSFDVICGKYDVVLIVIGVYKLCDFKVLGFEVLGIVCVLDYLIVLNCKNFGDDVLEYDLGELNVEGKNVVVIGGGDIVMDCVCIVICQGVILVKCLYCCDCVNMLGLQCEI